MEPWTSGGRWRKSGKWWYYSSTLGVDLPSAIASKMVKNAKKYPSSEYRVRFRKP
ncbi:hypothetical protein HN807_00865 [Candidatus Bathyarchaeota archaeon]|nr:hypothetical protein [Candidatus Bathyarchaeota archaeon]